MDPELVEAIAGFPDPKDITNLRSLIGLVNRFNDEVVLPSMQTRRAPRGVVEGWDLVRAMGGFNTTVGQRDLYSIAGSAAATDVAREKLQALQAQFDQASLAIPLRRVLKEAIAQEARVGGSLLRGDFAAEFAPLLLELQAAMQEAGKHEVKRGQRNKLLIGLDRAYKHLHRLAATADLCTREAHRLDVALGLLSRLPDGGFSAHCTAVLALLVGVHMLCEDWHTQQCLAQDDLQASEETFQAAIAARSEYEAQRAAGENAHREYM